MTTLVADDIEFAQVTRNHVIWPALALLGFIAANVASTLFSLLSL